MKRQLEEDGPIVAAFIVYKDFKYGRGEKLIYKVTIKFFHKIN